MPPADLPKLFEDATCYILGGGPSLTREICARLPAEQSIAINSIVKWKMDAAALYFHDYGWFRDNRPVLDWFRGHVITASLRAKKVLERDHMFHCVVPPMIPSVTITAGHACIDVCVALGARKIILLGFDCRRVNGRSHGHDFYQCQWSDELYSGTILPMWAGWGKRMKRKGVTVLNASADSAITEFEKVELGDVI